MDIIHNIIRLTQKFYDLGNISMIALLKNTGYFENYDYVNETKLFEELSRYPEYISKWLYWSENKRAASGWFFKRNDEGKYIIGLILENGGLKYSEYTNSAEACAIYIKKEIEEMRQLQ